MRRDNEDPRANAMKKLREAIDGYRGIIEQNPDQNPRNDVGLAEQVNQLGGQNAELVAQLEAMLNRDLERNGNLTQQGGELLRQLSELGSGINASLPQNQVGQALAGPDAASRIPLGGAGVNEENPQNQINELALRDLLSQFLRNLDIGREGRADGVRGEAGAGADGGASGGALVGAGAGAGAAGGAGGAGAVGEDKSLDSLIEEVTEVLTRRTEDFRRMQDERHQLRVQANEVAGVVENTQEIITQVIQQAEQFAEVGRAAEERARVAEAELARARVAAARAADERDAARANQAAQAAEAAQDAAAALAAAERALAAEAE